MINYEALIELAGAVFLLYNGTFIKTRYFNYAKGMFALVLLGMLFHIQHYPYNRELFAIGWLGILFIYGLSFINKPIKKLLDFLKLFWVLTVIPRILFRFFHYPYQEELGVISLILMSLALILFFCKEMNARNHLKQ